MDWLMELLKYGIDVAPYIKKLAESFATPDGPTDAQKLELATMEADLDDQLANAQPSAA